MKRDNHKNEYILIPLKNSNQQILRWLRRQTGKVRLVINFLQLY